MSIASNLQNIKERIAETAISCGRDPSSIKLVAVSKRHSIESIREAIAAGQQLFGENYIQEVQEKTSSLPGVAFHFIGHLQSNKAKAAAELFTMVETVDRFKLAKALNNRLQQLDRTLDILIQVNIGGDPKKSGVAPEKSEELLRRVATLPHVRVQGLMTIPPLSRDREVSRIHFRNLRLLGDRLGEQCLFRDNDNIELSMGMSHDYTTAIEEGATIVRVGTAVFGERPA